MTNPDNTWIRNDDGSMTARIGRTAATVTRHENGTWTLDGLSAGQFARIAYGLMLDATAREVRL